MSQVLGRNCRFLQGPDTEQEVVASVQACMAAGRECHVRMTNYRKSGATFTNLLSLRPVHDSDGVFRFIIGLQSNITFERPISSRAVVACTPSLACESGVGTDLDAPSLQKLEWQQRVFAQLPKTMRTFRSASSACKDSTRWVTHTEVLKKLHSLSGDSADHDDDGSEGDGEDGAGADDEGAEGEGGGSCPVEDGARDAENRLETAVRPSWWPRRLGSRGMTSIERAARGEVLVPGVAWLRSGMTFVGEHRRVLAEIEYSNPGQHGQSSKSPEEHGHLLTLTRLSWLQPHAGAEALCDLLTQTSTGTNSFVAFVARACPRLSGRLEALMNEHEQLADAVEKLEQQEEDEDVCALLLLNPRTNALNARRPRPQARPNVCKRTRTHTHTHA